MTEFISLKQNGFQAADFFATLSRRYTGTAFDAGTWRPAWYALTASLAMAAADG
jgi:hypothetical protein